MDTSKITYEKLIDQLKSKSPALENPERLAQLILEKVEKSSKKKKENRIPLIISWASTIAASLLLCLMAYEMAYSSEPLSVDNNPDVFAIEASGFNSYKAIKKSKDPDQLNDLIKLRKEKREKMKRLYANLYTNLGNETNNQ